MVLFIEQLYQYLELITQNRLCIINSNTFLKYETWFLSPSNLIYSLKKKKSKTFVHEMKYSNYISGTDKKVMKNNERTVR